MSFEFTPENKQEAARIIARYPNKTAALLPVLWLAQKQNGYLPLTAQKYVATLLALSPVHVYGVVTFYTMFKLKPVGKCHLQVCRTLSCALKGGDAIIRYVENRLKIRHGEITKDGNFSLEEVECLASCGTAPAMMVNEAYFENVTVEKLDQLIARLA